MLLEQHLASMQELLAVEESQTGTLGHTDLAERRTRRQMIGESLAHLASELRRQAARLNQLPALPDGTCVEWAQNILAYPNGRLLLVDTVFPALWDSRAWLLA